MAEPFIEKSSIPKQLAGRLQQVIRGGRWHAAGRLPPMRSLAQEFNISVATVQSAIQILQDQGLVDRQDRRGVFIKPELYRPRSSTFVGLLVPFYESDVNENRKNAFMHHLSFGRADTWDGNINRTFEQTLRAHHLDLLALPVAVDERGVVAAVMQRLERLGTPLAGAVIYGSSSIMPLAKALDERDLPWLSINPLSQRSVYNFVAADNQHGGRRVGRCLAGMGYRNVLVLSRSLGSFSTDVEKIMGLYQGFLEKGVPADQITVRTVGIPDEAAGYQATRQFLAEVPRPPQAIFAISDDLAAGAIRAVREAGIRIPDDVGVIGATGLKLYEQTDLPLTVLAQPMEQMGRHAAEMLTFMIREGVRRMVGRRVPGSLIFRQSLNVSDQLRQEAGRDYQTAQQELRATADDSVEASIRSKDNQAM